MVSGREWPGGDPWLQRQNEPTIAVSSANVQHIVGATNDYRTVDIPAADPGATIAGEAWLGVYKSLDGGQTWKSYLLPGYPQDAACAATAASKNPLCAIDGVPSPAAADPVVRAGTDGMFYVAGLNFVRDRTKSRIFLARYLDRNDKENGDATRGTDPIPYVDTRIVYTAPAGIFVDKPWIAVDVPRAGALTCTVTLADGTKRAFPGGTIWAGWAEFPATGPETFGNVMVASSRNCGETWSAPFKLNGVNSTISQGVSIAIEPITGRAYAAWRRFASGKQTDAIMAARSAGRSRQFSAGRVVAKFAPFDLNAGDWQAMIRTSAFPSLAISSNGSNSWAHVAWQQRGANQESRVVVSSAAVHPPPAGDQDADDPEDRDDETRVAWSAPAVVDEPAAEPGTPTPHAHQLMPALTFSQGRLVLTYYDSRLDHTRRYYAPYTPFAPDAAGRFYAETLGPKGAFVSGGALYDPVSFAPIFDAALSDEFLTQIRHTLDVRVAVATAGGVPKFQSSQVSQFAYGLRGDELADCALDAQETLTCPPLTIPTFGGTISLLGGGTVPQYLQQLQLNPPNLLIFKKNKRAFLGDYIDVQGVAFVPKPGGGWAYATAPSTAPVFHAVWTSNQDVRLPPPCPVDLFAPDGTLVCRAGTPDWSLYTPIKPGATSLYDGSSTAGNACDPTTGRPMAPASRDQNIYTSRITEGLAVSSPQNVKPLDATVVRAFVVLARNTTQKPITVTFDVPAASAAPGLRYSWVNDFGAAPVTALAGIVVPPKSHVYRSLFVKLGTATDPLSTLIVNVTETGACQAAVPASCRAGSITLNPPNAVATALVQPDGSVIPIASQEVYLPGFGPGAIGNPNITSPNITSPNITSPNITSPNITSPNITSPNITSPNITSPNITSNPDVAAIPAPNITSPNITSPNITSPNITSPNITSPNITSPNITSSTLSDASYEVTNTGNTTTSYHLKLATTGTANALPPVRVIVTKTYTTPTAVGCELKDRPQNQLVSTAVVDLGTPGGAVVTPDTTVDPGAADGRADNITFALAPGETNVVTLRGNLTLGQMLELVTTNVRPVPVAAAVVPTPGVTYASFPPPSAVPARVASTTVLGFDRTTSTGTVQVTGSGGTPTALVTLVRSGTSTAAVLTLAAGQASFSIAPPLGAGETLVAFYGGDARFLPSRSDTVTALARPIRVRSFYVSPLRAMFGVFDENDVPITNAFVALNGQPLTYDAVRQAYVRFQLDPPLNQGSTLALRVEAAGAVVTGRATIPFQANITAPARGDTFGIRVNPTTSGVGNALPMVVSWEMPAGAPTPTAGFNVWTQWNISSSVVDFWPAGAIDTLRFGRGAPQALPGDTSFTIPAFTFGSGTPTIAVEAVNAGTLEGDVDLGASTFSAWAGERRVGVTGGPIVIIATVDGNQLGNIHLARGGADRRTDQLPTCNASLQITDSAGTRLDVQGGRQVTCRNTTGQFDATPPIVIPAGERLTITAIFDNLYVPLPSIDPDVAFVSGVNPEQPVVTFPSAGAQLSVGSNVTAAWTSATNPQSFEDAFSWLLPSGPSSFFRTWRLLAGAAGTGRSDTFTVPAPASASLGAFGQQYELNALNLADSQSANCPAWCFFRLRSAVTTVPVVVP